MEDKTTTLQQLKDKVKKFCEDRDWDQFHPAKDLAIGISTESSELLAHFRFKSEVEQKKLFTDSKKREEIEDETADVLYFILRFAQMNKIDLSAALKKKIRMNEEKYPVSKAKGSNKKYSEF